MQNKPSPSYPKSGGYTKVCFVYKLVGGKILKSCKKDESLEDTIEFIQGNTKIEHAYSYI